MKEYDFNTFWNAYALKRDKMAAERAWKRLSQKDRRAALDGIAAYRNACQRDGIRMCYPQGYLNGHRWTDDMTPLEHPTPSRPPRQEQRTDTILTNPTNTDEMEVW